MWSFFFHRFFGERAICISASTYLPELSAVDAGDYPDTAVHDGGSDALSHFVGSALEGNDSAVRGGKMADLERYRMLTWYRGMAPMLALALALFPYLHAVNTMRAQVQSVAAN